MSRCFVIAEPGFLEAFRLKFPEPSIRSRPEPKFPGVLVREQIYGVRVIESRLLYRYYDGIDGNLPASIIHDFDRWFRDALSRVEWRKMQQEEQRWQNLNGAWRQ